MAAMRIPAALFAACLAAGLAAPSPPCAAAPYAVRLGLEKIALDALPGFSDTTELASPRLQDLAATLGSASNRVLLFALTDADLRRFSNGDPLDPKRRYLLAATPRELEREAVGSELFRALVAESLRVPVQPVPVDGLVKFLETRPVGLANLIEKLRDEADAVSVLQATRLQPLPGARMFDKDTPQYLVYTTTFVHLRSKALMLSVYTLFDGPADLEWLKLATRRWTDDLVRLNRR
jgi:hypothetical protein